MNKFTLNVTSVNTTWSTDFYYQRLEIRPVTLLRTQVSLKYFILTVNSKYHNHYFAAGRTEALS